MSVPRFLAPGIAVIDGDLHVDCVVVCREFGLVPTDENQDLVRRLIVDYLQTMRANAGLDEAEIVDEHDVPPWERS